MRNRGWKFLGVVVFLVAAIILIATLTIDGIVESTIEEKGSELLQTPVEIDEVDISIFAGTGSITGLKVDNPEGFSDEPAIRFSRADIRMKLTSLFSDEIVVEELIIQEPVVFFEQREAEANLKTLNDNFNLATGDDSEKALIIDYLRVEDILIRVHTSVDRERTGEATLEAFELEGIGREGRNTIKESLQEILEPLLERAMTKAIQEGLLDQIENRLRNFFDR